MATQPRVPTISEETNKIHSHFIPDPIYLPDKTIEFSTGGLRAAGVNQQTGQVYPHLIPSVKAEILLDWGPMVSPTVDYMQLEVKTLGDVLGYKPDGTVQKFVNPGAGTLLNLSGDTRYDRYVGDFTYIRSKPGFQKGTTTNLRSIQFKNQQNIQTLMFGNANGLKHPDDTFNIVGFSSLEYLYFDQVRQIKKIVFSGNTSKLRYLLLRKNYELGYVATATDLPALEAIWVHMSGNLMGGLEMWKEFFVKVNKRQGLTTGAIYGIQYSEELNQWFDENGYNWHAYEW